MCACVYMCVHASLCIRPPACLAIAPRPTLPLFQFLSPRTNKRTDAYGGNPANRRRLLLEVVNAVRAAVAYNPRFVRLCTL
jgi:hypothetical protein